MSTIWEMAVLDREASVAGNALDLRKLPLLVTERADRPGLQPSLDTIQVKHVATAPERDGQAVLVVWRRVRLVLDAGLVETVAADGAGVGADVP